MANPSAPTDPPADTGPMPAQLLSSEYQRVRCTNRVSKQFVGYLATYGGDVYLEKNKQSNRLAYCKWAAEGDGIYLDKDTSPNDRYLGVGTNNCATWGLKGGWREYVVYNADHTISLQGSPERKLYGPRGNGWVYWSDDGNNHDIISCEFEEVGPGRSPGWETLTGLDNMPGVPEASYTEIFDTAWGLVRRKREIAPAEQGLSVRYTLGGQTASAKDFLFDSKLNRHLEDAKQFAISWTTYSNVYDDGRKYLDSYASTLTSAQAATEAFWPTIAEHGTPYNLLILRRVTDARFAQYKKLLAESGLDRAFAPAHAQGRLYEIDLSLFESLGAWHYDINEGKPPRFNPATLTLLERDEKKKGVFEPKWIRVSTANREPEFYSPLLRSQTPGSWLYALQAVKSSVTLYGIWLGHVYHWHMVTAAMQRTMFDTIPSTHTVSHLLAPQSNYLIGFDYVLLYGAVFDKIAPPSRIADPASFLELTDLFAAGRRFFDDDPKTELLKNGLDVADFTRDKPWDMYPVVQNLLQIWDICERYVTAFVSTTYAEDRSVAGDAALQEWMKESADPRFGNIRGLPVMDNRSALTRVLASLVYRVTAHGIARLVHIANPALTFVANFPPCLQSEHIPSYPHDVSTQELLGYLPHTGTIGEMLAFYFAFSFSKPYVPLIPPGPNGEDRELYFGDNPDDPCNVALRRFRREMKAFMGDANVGQWPRNIET